MSDLDSLWGSSVQFFCQFKAGVSSSYKDYQATYKVEKRKELMWIHHFVILQLFHPKFCMEKDICFEHKNSGLFLRQFTLEETQKYINHFYDTPRWCGARPGGSKNNAVNLILRLFLYHFHIR